MGIVLNRMLSAREVIETHPSLSICTRRGRLRSPRVVHTLRTEFEPTKGAYLEVT